MIVRLAVNLLSQISFIVTCKMCGSIFLGIIQCNHAVENRLREHVTEDHRY